MKDHRKFKRILESAEISYRLIKNIKRSGALSKDISKGGVRFFVSEFIPKESILKMKIDLKKMPHSFEVTARVKWIKKRFANESFEIGVEFIDVPREDLSYLEQYIQNVNSKKMQEVVSTP